MENPFELIMKRLDRIESQLKDLSMTNVDGKKEDYPKLLSSASTC